MKSMEIIHTEKIKLTGDELQLLQNAEDMLINIYQEAANDDICNPADAAIDAIRDLLDFCE